ncbi:RNA binding metal dependent phosphohydrolase [Oscillochloris trichoides DG-6]|uniref:Ribonuclease Y n=1 Tax=Oscillochloris trichoides DG-6 TaxID=765420 RepID=E1IAM2_9CHLR|nr:ribonuclease Y [Oscillochloris trichoides]EFO81796.1 RNA binding metal dependent phosphohydrolase [Oscillochloris trichoides DG-6]
MIDLLWASLGLVVGLVAGGAIGIWWVYNGVNSQMQSKAAEARLLLEEARSQQKEILLQAKDDALRIRNDAEAEIRESRQSIQKQEERLQRKEENLDRKIEGLERRDRQVQNRERQIEQSYQEAERVKGQQVLELERISQLNREEAREIILAQVEREARDEAARRIREIEQSARNEAEKNARKIIGLAVQRCASDYVAELTVTTVNLPSEELKGRIIGREGRNIRAFEQITGVDIIVDDTPEAVTLSCHDPVRREVARVSLTRLLKDGRIHPTRIEEIVQKTQLEIEHVMREEGERVAYEANVQGLHPDLIKLLGRLKYRTSYGQNVLQHSLECALLAAHMAAEIGANITIAKTAALLHDIGKAVDHEVQGPHALIGADIARRLGRSPAIVHAIAAHHHDEEPQTVEAFLVIAADAISGGRPGARRETLDLYIKRLEALETVATSFSGVQRAFAVQAGREVRVMVQPDQIDDLASIHLARDVAKKIEESLQYPGQIKVTIIRETRAVDFAR